MSIFKIIKAMFFNIFRKMKYSLFTYGSICEHELVWCSVWNTATKNVSWLNSDDMMLFPGRWAIGYNTMYVLFRVLYDTKPQTVLEFGLGNSTKIISCFLKYSDNKDDLIKHVVVEHDEQWISFFKNANKLYENTCIFRTDITKKIYKKRSVTAYCDIEPIMQTKYNLILIDGPFGVDGRYSRMDIVEFLPDCLDDSFVIIIDDHERKGEKGLSKEIKRVLGANNIEYCWRNYWGQAECCVICSKNNIFLTSL